MNETLDQGGVEVRETHGGKFEQRVRAGVHTFIADEPREVGGDDFGPGPYDLLLAALGTCTSMTVRMYADRKQIPLTHITVRLRHERVHAADAASEQMPPLERLTREITLEGDLTAEQRTKLMDIAGKCPVHRTLTGRLEIVTRQA